MERDDPRAARWRKLAAIFFFTIRLDMADALILHQPPTKHYIKSESRFGPGRFVHQFRPGKGCRLYDAVPQHGYVTLSEAASCAQAFPYVSPLTLEEILNSLFILRGVVHSRKSSFIPQKYPKNPKKSAKIRKSEKSKKILRFFLRIEICKIQKNPKNLKIFLRIQI